ncbi:Alpha/Beta hydrolase protein [Vararia minispora EC-137]|uniref:Alpha/Beta hydrolase protein n=1 Tax=Vararia minispora EC-137 TaxID=1314806 RepID=A0ACB8QP20_9AGAM|nr:Alpha/Beta hydrolase protein [Vararia minispora EC-137]
MYYLPSHLPSSSSLSRFSSYRYARESLVNFRWISRICATRSHRLLTSADRLPVEITLALSQHGQFAELAYTPVPLPHLFRNIHILSREHFPLEGYDALLDSELVYHTRGKVADVQAFVVYRPSTRQLVTAFSGTSNVAQCLYDLRLSHHHYHTGAVRRGRVHNGFWKMFKGLRLSIMRSLEAACRRHQVDEIVLTGHSLGGALAYLFALETLSAEYALPPGIKIIVTTFGAPRTGDQELVDYWVELVDSYRAAHGPDALREYCVKGYRDGVPAIPPASLGYRHFCREPLYFVHGKLYRIPSSEREHALFDIEPVADVEAPLHPRGGHNYYNGRNMENAFRRLQFLGDIIEKRSDGWEDRYLKRVRKRHFHTIHGAPLHNLVTLCVAFRRRRCHSGLNMALQSVT